MWWAPFVGIPYGTGPGELTCWSSCLPESMPSGSGVELPAVLAISAPRSLIAVARADAGAAGAVAAGGSAIPVLTWC